MQKGSYILQLYKTKNVAHKVRRYIIETVASGFILKGIHPEGLVPDETKNATGGLP